MVLFNLLDQYGFYAVHHNNKINKLLHIVVIPVVIFTFRISTLVALALSSYCVYLDTKIGVITSIWIMLTDYLANSKIDNLGLEKATTDGISLLGISLVLLIIGHLIFEGITPGLPSEPLAMFVAPLFITMELLFMLGFLNQQRLKFQCRINSYCKYRIIYINL
ncbi:hypothetical protein DICPUDRAFT_88308 [Dictyostelium purpureum]|uniref:Uncharacterized protein n=1 Tax=Dictyostelium purpureum TaxID=5786 RepID=F0ZNL0_DICPU|nr:uncharacterized protein DICPUDRAFT_88308 [Dictyostelium purpureum]EGC34461.1 hypothetical protein DICPUDRAFT_88308 [Dictyostelium purpureum]|eukprot:XP_003288996.1 hypothetical protein DICPUDRAFT_88308 [Dictyostelium purpureum]